HPPGPSSVRGGAPASVRASVEPRSSAGAALPWPTGVTPTSEDLRIDDTEVRTLAGFGPPPAFFLLAPVYAARVLLRRRALEASSVAAEADLRKAEQDRDEQLVRVAEQARPLLEANDR